MSELAQAYSTNGPRLVADWLGVGMRPQFLGEQTVEQLQRLMPGDVHEWETLIRAVDAAHGSFTMVEVGAGFGRWTVNAGAAARRFRPDLRHRLVAVEAEPTHYRWLRQHTRANGLRRWSRTGTCRLVQAAVSGGGRGREPFYVGDPGNWYGQALVRPDNAGFVGTTTDVATVTLDSLLAGLYKLDLIDMDVQGAELEILEQAQPLLHRVAHCYVETHSDDVHDRVRALLSLTHQIVVDVKLGSVQQTQFGEACFDGGGVLACVWLRPHASRG